MSWRVGHRLLGVTGHTWSGHRLLGVTGHKWSGHRLLGVTGHKWSGHILLGVTGHRLLGVTGHTWSGHRLLGVTGHTLSRTRCCRCSSRVWSWAGWPWWEAERTSRPLQSALCNYSSEFSAEDFNPENLTKESLTEIIASSEKEIEKLKVGYQNKSLVLRRMQLNDAIHRKLLETDTQESKLIYETLEHSKGLCKHILKAQKETRTLEEKLIAVRKKRLELKETCTALMTELKDEHDSADSNLVLMENPNFKKINQYIAKEIDIVTVIQNVFQRLILGSKVNWAEEPKLREIVLSLGKSPA